MKKRELEDKLIEPTKHAGGLSTSGIDTAESEHMLKWTIGGFADDVFGVPI